MKFDAFYCKINIEPERDFRFGALEKPYQHGVKASLYLMFRCFFTPLSSPIIWSGCCWYTIRTYENQQGHLLIDFSNPRPPYFPWRFLISKKSGIKQMANDTQVLTNARKGKNDEFYTSYDVIAKELNNYAKYFRGKTIYCNCDDHYGIGKGTPKSNFIKYLSDNFEAFGIKRVIATHYEKDSKSTMYILDKDNTGDGIVCSEDILERPLNGDGDFRSPECIELLKQADIIITNPPFSLFREYVAQLMEYGKKFIIIGNVNAITYKDFFSLIKVNKVWLGMSIHSGDREFRVPRDYPLNAVGYRIDSDGNKYIRVKGVRWYTNLDHSQRHEYIETGKKYYGYESMYPKYDNYDAIEVGAVKNMPMDYNGIMGVPITFLDKYNPSQFKLLGIMNTGEENKGIRYENTPHGRPIVNGKELYLRVLITAIDNEEVSNGN